MKPQFARHHSLRAALSTFAFCAAAAGLVRCTNSSTTTAGNQFVGNWSCPASFAPIAPTLAISENLDGSLTITGEGDGGGTFCTSDLWTYSGATATMKSGTSCTGGPTAAEVITVNSFTMTVSGNKLTVSANETVASQDYEADGGFDGPPTKSVLSVSGVCTK